MRRRSLLKGIAASVFQIMFLPDLRLQAGTRRSVSGSNYFNASWQKEYWGTNYSRLRAIKRKYDPDGLFFVHHGVGSEEWSGDGFTRLQKG
jgi:hypothetical protein